MTLSALIKKGGITSDMTRTVATTVTPKVNRPATVAPVTTVTVAKGTELASALLPDEEANILAWLAHIEEVDSAVISEVLRSCRDDLGSRQYFLKRSEEAPEPVIHNGSVTCGNCIQFERIQHPNLGHCAKGEPEAIAGLWGSDRRCCEQYSAMPIELGIDE